MTNFTLKDLEERLDPEVFFRAHKSRLVNLNARAGHRAVVRRPLQAGHAQPDQRPRSS